MARRLGYRVFLWALVAGLLVAISALAFMTRGMTAEESWTYRQWLVVVLIPFVAVFLTRILVPRRKSRVEDFRPSPFEEDRPKREVGESPAAFSKRLAGYLHVSEEEVLAAKPPATSSMPFWSSVSLPQRSVWAKSVAYIRAVLARIRDAVRG